MGIFDKIFNKITNAAGKAADKSSKQGDTRSATQSVHRDPMSYPYDPNKKYNTSSTPPPKIVAYFEGIFRTDFNEYGVIKNAPVETVNPKEGGKGYRNYTFCLTLDGRVMAAIMLTPHNTDARRDFMGAKAASMAAGVPFINFFSHFENKRDYVVNRIKKAI